MTRAWIDIDNPPQVQYLAPLARAFEDAGADVVITARDSGMTYDLLRRRGREFFPIGSRFGKSKAAKGLGLVRRARALRAAFRKRALPDLLVGGSRSATLTARSLRIPAFVVCDYEHVHLELDRRLGTHLLFPDVIDPSAFTSRGFRRRQLLPFRGLKEDITFAGVATHDFAPQAFPHAGEAQVRVLFRPPAEESHYYKSKSGSVAMALLERLADDSNVALVFSPRYEWQEQQLQPFAWRTEPIVLRRPLPFVSLLTGVDLVVSGGGTMLREAAYLGVPAYSLLQSEIGAVDRYLESIGRLAIVTSNRDFDEILLTKRPRKPLLRTNPDLVEELVETVAARTG